MYRRLCQQTMLRYSVWRLVAARLCYWEKWKKNRSSSSCIFYKSKLVLKSTNKLWQWVVKKRCQNGREVEHGFRTLPEVECERFTVCVFILPRKGCYRYSPRISSHSANTGTPVKGTLLSQLDSHGTGQIS